jgi:biotin-dependent carboxylase-like uncharacterized protein
MSAALRVIAPGLHTTIQDLGRPGYQNMGVPVSGALDAVGLAAANVLVGNPGGAGALEIAYRGPTLLVEAGEVRLACAGADATIRLYDDDTRRGFVAIDALRSFRARRGQVIDIGSLRGGAVLYVAVEGGFDITPTLGSVSTCARIRMGGWQGRALAAGDRLPLAREAASPRPEQALARLQLDVPRRFRVIPGPQADYFSAASLATFFSGDYRVGVGSDRMGMRLEGAVLDHARGHDIVSDAIAPGSIQVPGNGQPIVLLADRQTTGGYPKIATVISADLPALGRVPIGARIAFRPVAPDEALAARRQMKADVDALKDMLVPVAPGAQELEARLASCNLISGAVAIDMRTDASGGWP